MHSVPECGCGPTLSIGAIVASQQRMVSQRDAPLRQHGHVARVDYFLPRLNCLGAHVGGITRERHGLQPR